jgi:hypothetical protein
MQRLYFRKNFTVRLWRPSQAPVCESKFQRTGDKHSRTAYTITAVNVELVEKQRFSSELLTNTITHLHHENCN